MDDHPLEELSESECWTLLRSVGVGRLATPTQRGGIEIFPVNHVVDQGSLVFRTALGTKLSAAIDAHEVAFEADNAASSVGEQQDDPWSVVVHGTAELISLDTQLFDSFELAVHPWHLSDKPYFIRVVPTVVSGRRFRIDPMIDPGRRRPTQGDTMVQHLIVPVDGSDASWRAVDVAVGLARRGDASVDVVEVVFDQHDTADAEARLAERLEQHDTAGVSVSRHVRAATESVAQAIATEVERHPEATVVLASHGRGRSAALLGSVTEELLERIFGPVLVVGPHATAGAFDGPVIATVDGSDASESVLPLAAAWGIELRSEPWIVEVADPDVHVSRDVSESAYPARLARKLAKNSGHPVQFEVLHGEHVHDEVADFATSIHASMIVASTRGRTGVSRFVIGSTAAAIVRHAPCPVLLVRPPHLPH